MKKDNKQHEEQHEEQQKEQQKEQQLPAIQTRKVEWEYDNEEEGTKRFKAGAEVTGVVQLNVETEVTQDAEGSTFWFTLFVMD